MILWEISSFNKLFKTDMFGLIRSRCKDNKHIFAITTTKKITTEINNIQPTDICPTDELKLREKYKVFKGNSTTLYLYEAFNVLSMMGKFITMEESKAYEPYITLGCHLADSSLEDYKVRLGELNSKLCFRTTLLFNKITPADLFVISGMKRSKHYTTELQKTYQHVNRWAEWIQELHGVDYERIRKQLVKKLEKQEKGFIRLISSKELIDAVKNSKYEEVKTLIDVKKANIESIDLSNPINDKPSSFKKSKGQRSDVRKMPLEQVSLHIACDKLDFPMVKILIERGANPNSEDRDGMTPLYYAILRRATEICDYLLDNGAELEHKECQDRTPLYWASSLGETEMLDYLMRKGANVNAISKLGRTALSKACWNGQLSVVKKLLQCKNVSFFLTLDQCKSA